MARPRELDEEIVLDMAVQCFRTQGYEATSIRDLVERTGMTVASLYNAFGDKRSLYQKTLDQIYGRQSPRTAWPLQETCATYCD